jgi:hypothetical protein
MRSLRAGLRIEAASVCQELALAPDVVTKASCNTNVSATKRLHLVTDAGTQAITPYFVASMRS